MRPLRALFGLLFVGIGIVALLDVLGLPRPPWEFIVQLWPVLLVVAGLSLLSAGRLSFWALLLLTVLVLGGFIAIGYERGWLPRDEVWESGQVRSQTLSFGYVDPTEKASFRFDSGAGSFAVEETTDDQLIEARTETSWGEYSLSHNRNGTREEVTLAGPSGRWRIGRQTNTVAVKLNPSPEWSIDLNTGGSTTNLSLIPFKVTDLTIDSGAASVEVALGDRADETRVAVNAGVSSITIRVPRSSGVEVVTKSGLTGRDFPGFTKIDASTYRSEGYGESVKRVFITFKAGVSSVKVERY